MIPPVEVGAAAVQQHDEWLPGASRFGEVQRNSVEERVGEASVSHRHARVRSRRAAYPADLADGETSKSALSSPLDAFFDWIFVCKMSMLGLSRRFRRKSARTLKRKLGESARRIESPRRSIASTSREESAL